MDVVVRHNAFENNEALVPNAGGVNIRSGGTGAATNLPFDISDNSWTGPTNSSGGSAAAAFFVSHDEAAGLNGSFSGTINDNTVDGGTAIATGGVGDGIFVRDSGASTGSVLVSNNTIQHFYNAGIAIQNNSGSATLNATLYGNTVSTPVTNDPYAALDVENGATASDTSTTNVVIGSSGGAGSANTLTHNGTYATDVELSNFNSNPANGPVTHLNLSKNGSTATTVQGVITADNNGSPLVDTTGGNGSTTLVTTLPTLPPVVQPLLAAPGGVQASTPTPGVTDLTQAELDSVVAAAIADWAAAGASASQLAALHATTFGIADLSGNIIGEETSPAHITIDASADGNGWFIDPTPTNNSEFPNAQNASGTDLLTDPSNAAAGHMDLLTTVVHELGHVLGLPDLTDSADTNDLMYINLVDGERRLPDAADVVSAIEASLPLAAQAAAGSPLVAGTAGNDTLNAGHGGNILFGGAGADHFVFGPGISSAAPLTHIADYNAAQGDTIDLTALFPGASVANANPLALVHAVEDASGTFATLQINTAAAGQSAHWVDIAQLDGVHLGDGVDVSINSSHPSATVEIQSETAAALAQDNFVFATSVQPAAPIALPVPPVTHSFGTFDFSALTSQFHSSDLSDAMLVRAVEDPSGTFATLQVNSNSMGLKYGPTGVGIEHLAGAHLGDAVNVLVDSHAAVHLAQLHVDLLV